MKQPIKTFAINLTHRTDRRDHILRQFKNRSEFSFSLFPAIEHQRGELGLWLGIRQIIREHRNEELLLICEDDHSFSKEYSANYLYKCIEEAMQYSPDILLGGVSWLGDVAFITEDIFWIDKFTGTQFMIVFRRFYDTILSAEIPEAGGADYIISSLTDRKFVIYPFISRQKEFGYSDVTEKNNETGYVKEIFRKTTIKLGHLKKVALHYNHFVSDLDIDVDDFSIPTYAINLKSRPLRRAHILKQFDDKPEFSVEVIDASEHTIGAIGLWNSIVRIVKKAMSDDDDVILIVEDDHEFTDVYEKKKFFRHIINAHSQGALIMSGGIGDFGYALEVGDGRYWVNPFLSTQFIILYKGIFRKICNYQFREDDVADKVLAELTSHKMVIYPYISNQKDFGYSDITLAHNEQPGLVQVMFERSQKRLQKIKEAYQMFKSVNSPSVK